MKDDESKKKDEVSVPQHISVFMPEFLRKLKERHDQGGIKEKPNGK